MENSLWRNCRALLQAYKDGTLGDTTMPEDAHPLFSNAEQRLTYFTLPMALNYQRNSFVLWKAALETSNDSCTRDVFDVVLAAQLSNEELRARLSKYKLALQPNKHIDTWKRLAVTFASNWSGIEGFFQSHDNDFLKIKETIQQKRKKEFPYLSGPKIFNYWSFIISSYGGIELKNKNFIDIAPDTHVTKCSVRLGVITLAEAEKLSKEEVSDRWRELLNGSGIEPIEMHPPLWFWSRNGFTYKLKNN